MTQVQRYHQITDDRKDEFVARGYKGRYFFPHRAYYLPRPLPEQIKTARRFWNITDPDALWCVLLYANDETVSRFPTDLFFDPEVMIHNEHMGRPGLVASAPLYIDGDRLYTDEHQSDLVQRVIHRREHKSQVEKRFGTWHHMLLNCILNFAVGRGMREIHVPTAQRVVSKYIGRDVNPELFERLYNNNIQAHFNARLEGDTWVISVAEHRDKLVPMTPETEHVEVPARSVCVIHDIEPSGDPDAARGQIESVTEVERREGIVSTWCVPGRLHGGLRDAIRHAGGQAAFRSFDDARYRYSPLLTDDESPRTASLTRNLWRVVWGIRKRLGLEVHALPTVTELSTRSFNRFRRIAGRRLLRDTLRLCRDADYYLKGYRRTPLDIQSGMADDWLRYYHFEWVIEDDAPTPTRAPRYDRGLMTFPVSMRFDGVGAFAEQFEQALQRDAVTVINLPLSSSDHWLKHLPDLVRIARAREATVRSVQDIVNAFHFSRSA